MDCREVQNRLDEFAMGGLVRPDRARVAGHLDGCPACRDGLEETQTLLAECRRVLRHPMPVDRFEEIRAVIDRERRLNRATSLDRAWRRRTGMNGLAAAAALAIFVCLGARLDVPGEPREESGSRAFAAVRLADTEVWPLVVHRIRTEVYLDLSAGPVPVPEVSTEPARPEHTSEAAPTPLIGYRGPLQHVGA